MFNVVAGTGHRPQKLGGYGDDVKKRLERLAIDWLEMYRTQSYSRIRVISGMALGWDQALAFAAIKLGIPVTAAVPCENYESKWPKASISAYKLLLEMCDDVEFVSKTYTGPHVMQLRNEWMVDRCNLLLALWDGSNSGTGNCIKYAQGKGVLVENLWHKYKI